MHPLPLRHHAPRALFCLMILIWMAALSGCVRLYEPPSDPRIVAGLEALAEATETLSHLVETGDAAARAPVYASLVAQAAALEALATQRAAGLAIPPRDGAYGIATAGYLADYRRQIGLMAERDAAQRLIPAYAALRLAAMRDALDDALFYERTVLDRRHPAAL